MVFWCAALLTAGCQTMTVQEVGDTPVIGAGYVTAFVQVMNQPPVVREFESVGSDISTVTGWWQNKLLRIFLVFILTGIGSMIGTWVGGIKIFTNLLS